MFLAIAHGTVSARLTLFNWTIEKKKKCYNGKHLHYELTLRAGSGIWAEAKAPGA
jgi:hypothetical protein